jgi:uncharacterized protein YbjT (DUF2867 family)
MESSKRTYVVTGATGRIGAQVARGLLEAGHEVRAVGRNADGLKALADQGAKPFSGDLQDAAFAEHAFRGADAALLLVAGDRMSRDFRRGYGDVGRVFANALRTTGVGAAVFISCIGAHDEKYRGLVLVHKDVEKALDEVPNLDLLHVRAAPYFENLFYWLPVIRARDALATPINPDAKLDMVQTNDVAAVALQRLLKLDFRGRNAIEVHGREVLTMRQVAEKIGKHLGRAFRAEQTPREAVIEGLIAHGMSVDFAHMMNDAWDTFSRYGLLRAPGMPVTTRGTTAIDDFLREQFLPALAQESETAKGLERLAKATSA